MKKRAILMVMLLILTGISGQGQALRKLDKLIQVGPGIRSYAVGGLWNGSSAELGFSETLSAGGFFDYACQGQSFGNRKWKYQFLAFGLRGSYHLGKLLGVTSPRLDPYAGMLLGVGTVLWRGQQGDHDQKTNRHSRALPGAYAGVRYRFSPKVGGFAEGGYGTAILRLGLMARL